MKQKTKKQVTIIPCSPREFKFRWWGWGLFAWVMGIITGVLIAK